MSNGVAFLGTIVTSSIISTLLQGVLKSSAPAKVAGENGDTHMSYELVGYDNDDDFGGVGADEILQQLVSGTSMPEIVGALYNAARGGNTGAAQAVKALVQKNASAVVERPLDRKRRMPLGIVPTSVAAGSAGIIPSQPQNMFRPERLVVPSDIAFDFGITDIKVGNMSQFVQGTEVPGALFSEVAINTGVHFDTAVVGNQLTVSVRNKTAGALEFTGAAVGTVAK